MRYQGSCHCGKVAFEVEGQLDGAVACNCSICARKGALLWTVPRGQLTLLTPEDSMSRYTFHNHVIEHRFCRTCGMHPYAEDVSSKGDRTAYVNIRCLQDVDLAAIPVHEFDGRSM